MIHDILSLTIWVPIIGGMVTLCGWKNDNLARYIALSVAILGLILSFIVYQQFNPSFSGMQFEENLSWVKSLNINYHLGVDGISMPFLLLNNFITLTVIIAGWKVVKDKVALYNSMFLIMTGFMSAVFCALDAIVFYVFFEAMLIPMYLIIGVWGSSNRVYAAIKFFLYTLLGSLLMLVVLIYLYNVSGHTFEIFHLL